MSESSRLSLARWFFGEQPDAPLEVASREAARLVASLTGSDTEVVARSGDGCRIAAGSPEHNSVVRAANLPELREPGAPGNPLGRDDYVIRSATIDGRA